MLTVTKRLVDIDDQLLERARAVSGEKTIKGTIEAALKKLANDEIIMRHLHYLKTSKSDLDMTPAEIMSLLRDPDYPLEGDDGDR